MTNITSENKDHFIIELTEKWIISNKHKINKSYSILVGKNTYGGKQQEK